MCSVRNPCLAMFIQNLLLYLPTVVMFYQIEFIMNLQKALK